MSDDGQIEFQKRCAIFRIPDDGQSSEIQKYLV